MILPYTPFATVIIQFFLLLVITKPNLNSNLFDIGFYFKKLENFVLLPIGAFKPSQTFKMKPFSKKVNSWEQFSEEVPP